MNKKTAIVGALGLGAALMYFLDPDRGKRRRALVRDKFEAAGTKTSDYAVKMSRDIRNRAYGMVAETKSLFRTEPVSDDVLADRVRAKLGRYPVDLGAVEVRANDGVVTLSGPILSTDSSKVIAAARLVRGVKGVENQLTMDTDPESIPSLEVTPASLGTDLI